MWQCQESNFISKNIVNITPMLLFDEVMRNWHNEWFLKVKHLVHTRKQGCLEQQNPFFYLTCCTNYEWINNNIFHGAVIQIRGWTVSINLYLIHAKHIYFLLLFLFVNVLFTLLSCEPFSNIFYYISQWYVISSYYFKI